MSTPYLKYPDIPNLEQDLVRAVTTALEEDIGPGDITAQLIPENQIATATIITREACVVCGVAWAEEVFTQLDDSIKIQWQVNDGDFVAANTQFCTLEGNTRALLTGERTALNFLQLLSGTATTSREYARLVEGSNTKILDTRKTIPGLRTAQKYAVRCGGCHNHRIGLYDAFLIKENHITACGGVKESIDKARKLYPNKKIEIEVENIAQLKSAIESKVDVVMLDNFTNNDLSEAVSMNKLDTQYEISGNINKDSFSGKNLDRIDYISIGLITKKVSAIDLTMRIAD